MKKKSKLDIDDFDKILRYTGFECLKQQKIEFTKDELLIILSKAKSFWNNICFNESDILDDLLCAVPLFCQDGVYYKWSHKSLQEYFAAQFIYKDSKSGQDKILTTLYNSDYLEKYINLLDLYYDIDQLGFRKNILLPFLRDFAAYFETSSMGRFEDITSVLYNRKCYTYLTKETIDFNDVLSKIIEIDRSFRPFVGMQVNRNTWNIFLIDGSTSYKRPVLSILSNKNLPFIKELKYFSSKEDSEEGLSSIEKLKIHDIEQLLKKNIHNDLACREVGAILSSLGEHTLYLDYNMSIREINSIQKEISISQETDNLLSGL